MNKIKNFCEDINVTENQIYKTIPKLEIFWFKKFGTEITIDDYLGIYRFIGKTISLKYYSIEDIINGLIDSHNKDIVHQLLHSFKRVDMGEKFLDFSFKEPKTGFGFETKIVKLIKDIILIQIFLKVNVYGDIVDKSLNNMIFNFKKFKNFNEKFDSHQNDIQFENNDIQFENNDIQFENNENFENQNENQNDIQNEKFENFENQNEKYLKCFKKSKQQQQQQFYKQNIYRSTNYLNCFDKVDVSTNTVNDDDKMDLDKNDDNKIVIDDEDSSSDVEYNNNENNENNENKNNKNQTNSVISLEKEIGVQLLKLLMSNNNNNNIKTSSQRTMIKKNDNKLISYRPTEILLYLKNLKIEEVTDSLLNFFHRATLKFRSLEIPIFSKTFFKILQDFCEHKNISLLYNYYQANKDLENIENIEIMENMENMEIMENIEIMENMENTIVNYDVNFELKPVFYQGKIKVNGNVLNLVANLIFTEKIIYLVQKTVDFYNKINIRNKDAPKKFGKLLYKNWKSNNLTLKKRKKKDITRKRMKQLVKLRTFGANFSHSEKYI